MKVEVRRRPTLEPDATEKIERMVADALQSVVWPLGSSDFVANDSLWVTSRGTAVVMNKADYISETFLNHLRDAHSWKKNFTIDQQEIDGYLEIELVEAGYTVDESELPSLLQRLIKDGEDVASEFPLIYRKYVERAVFQGHGILRDHGRRTTSREASNRPLFRVGLEFETGNIASSFRAFTKLNHLFLNNHIDCGVFVTALNKAECSTRIWPASNRNGSFEELDNRNYQSSILFPIWEFGFRPDGFSESVPHFYYTKSEGPQAYSPARTGKSLEIGGVAHEEFERSTSAPYKLYRPQKSQVPEDLFGNDSS